MAGWGRRSGRGLVPLVAAVLLAGCASAPAAVTPPSAHVTAASACAAGVGTGWQVAVEVDRADRSVLALGSGDSIASCQVSANSDRTGFGSTVIGTGLYPAVSPPTLSYLTGGGTGDKMTFLVGRVPTSASVVHVVPGRRIGT